MADPLFFTAFFMYATCMVVSCMVLGTNPDAGGGINGVRTSSRGGGGGGGAGGLQVCHLSIFGLSLRVVRKADKGT